MNKFNYIPVFLIIPFLIASYFFGYTPLLIAFIYVLFSVLAFVGYAKDKHAARYGQWRVSEGTLHTFSLLCGWPGAIFAQRLFRHKTRKTSFRVVFWFTVLVNSGVLVWLHTAEGSALLHTYTSLLEELVSKALDEGKTREILSGFLHYTE